MGSGPALEGVGIGKRNSAIGQVCSPPRKVRFRFGLELGFELRPGLGLGIGLGIGLGLGLGIGIVLRLTLILSLGWISKLFRKRVIS